MPVSVLPPQFPPDFKKIKWPAMQVNGTFSFPDPRNCCSSPRAPACCGMAQVQAHLPFSTSLKTGQSSAAVLSTGAVVHLYSVCLVSKRWDCRALH